jgi:hypothetical protein
VPRRGAFRSARADGGRLGKSKAPSEIEYKFKTEIQLKGATLSATPSTPRERGLTQGFSISSFSPRSSMASKVSLASRSREADGQGNHPSCLSHSVA